MSSVDTAWLRMDRPGNPMQIVGVMIFDGRLDPGRLRRAVSERLLRYPRFRQFAEEGTDGGWWADDDSFDIDAHVRQNLLPAPRGTRELQKFVAELASQPLNPSRPLWDIHLVDSATGDSALVLRFHHAIADGIALAAVVESLTDERADGRQDAGAVSADGEALRAGVEKNSDTGALVWKTLYEPIGGLALASIRIGGNLCGQCQGLWNDPATIFDYASVAAAIAKEVGNLALMPNDSATRFKGKPGAIKCVAWSEPIDLAEIKAVARVLDCSLNDLALAAVAGAFRGYLLEKGDSAAGVEIRALVPANLRAAGSNGSLGNHFGFLALELPLGIENPLARLYATRARMAALKDSYQASVTYGMLGLLGMAPKFLQQQVLDRLAGKATAVMTNVVRPQHARYLSGAKVRQEIFWVPRSGDIGIGVSILSYAGKLQFGLISDKTIVADPERIVGRFAGEFENLLLLVLMEPWPRLHDPDAVEQALKNESGRKPARRLNPAQGVREK